jgi:hypothetical protein
MAGTRKKELPEALRRNLWKPGQSGNPGGRPKKLTGPLEEFLSRRVPHDKQKRQYVDLLIESMVKRAIAKSDPLIKEILNSTAVGLQFSSASKGTCQMILQLQRSLETGS